MYGLPNIKNEFGIKDMTPYNAANIISGNKTIDDIKL